MTKTADKPQTIIEAAKAAIPEGTLVDIVSRKGRTLPLEWPRRNDDKRIKKFGPGFSDCDYDTHGRMVNKVEVRNLEFGLEQRQTLDLDDVDDREFYERIKEWHANSGDKRIHGKWGVQIVEG